MCRFESGSVRSHGVSRTLTSSSPSTANWGPASDVKQYKDGAPVTGCRGGVRPSAYMWFNGYVAPAQIDNPVNGVTLPGKQPGTVFTAGNLRQGASPIQVLANGTAVNASNQVGWNTDTGDVTCLRCEGYGGWFRKRRRTGCRPFAAGRCKPTVENAGSKSKCLWWTVRRKLPVSGLLRYMSYDRPQFVCSWKRLRCEYGTLVFPSGSGRADRLCDRLHGKICRQRNAGEEGEGGAQTFQIK